MKKAVIQTALVTLLLNIKKLHFLYAHFGAFLHLNKLTLSQASFCASFQNFWGFITAYCSLRQRSLKAPLQWIPIGARIRGASLHMYSIMSRNSETVLNEIWDAFKLLLNKPLAVKRAHPMMTRISKTLIFFCRSQSNLTSGLLTVDTDKGTFSFWLWFLSIMISFPLLLLFWAMTTLNCQLGDGMGSGWNSLFFHLDSLKSAFLSSGLSRWASCPSGLPVMLLLGPPNGPGSPVVSPNNCHWWMALTACGLSPDIQQGDQAHFTATHTGERLTAVTWVRNEIDCNYLKHI